MTEVKRGRYRSHVAVLFLLIYSAPRTEMCRVLFGFCFAYCNLQFTISSFLNSASVIFLEVVR
jgi:hypothetical protein